MKTVTIPTSQSPFVVMVNGAKYVYPAGSVQDVPDEVAVVIEAHNKQTAKPNEPVEAPFDCDCGGGGGGGVSWNDLKDKPFYDSPTGGDTLYWDGNTDGLVSVMDMLYKVSDALPTMDDFSNGCIVTFPSGSTYEVTAEQIAEMNAGLTSLIIITEFCFIALEDGADVSGLLLPERGIYCADIMTSLTIPGYTGFPNVKKLDEKYLPEAGADSAGIIKKSDIINTIRCSEPVWVRIGKTTYKDLELYMKYILPTIYWNDTHYYCITLNVYGYWPDGTNLVGKAEAIAIEGTGKTCLLDITLDGTEENSLVTNVTVDYVPKMEQ